jgi:hypothetical protein
MRRGFGSAADPAHHGGDQRADQQRHSGPHQQAPGVASVAPQILAQGTPHKAHELLPQFPAGQLDKQALKAGLRQHGLAHLSAGAAEGCQKLRQVVRRLRQGQTQGVGVSLQDFHIGHLLQGAARRVRIETTRQPHRVAPAHLTAQFVERATGDDLTAVDDGQALAQVLSFFL